MNKNTSREYWTEFIDLYRSKQVLWKLDSNKYKNRSLKKEAYEELAVKLKEIEPTADIEMVKRKLDSLRASYRRELRKKRRFGYISKWAYFDLFSFLSKKRDPLFDETKDEPEDDERSGETENEEEIEYPRFTPSPPTVSKPKRRSKSKISSNPIARKAFVKLACQQYTKNYDDADILSCGWAVQYRDLSMQQKLFAKKAIDDILFEAQLGTLNRHSVKINENIHMKDNNTSGTE